MKNIEKKVKEEYQHVKENVKRARKSREFEKTRNVLDEIFHALGRIIVVFLKIIIIVVGVGFILAGLSALMALTGAFAFSSSFFPLFRSTTHSSGPPSCGINVQLSLSPSGAQRASSNREPLSSP